jgi:hypothetical protein
MLRYWRRSSYAVRSFSSVERRGGRHAPLPWRPLSPQAWAVTGSVLPLDLLDALHGGQGIQQPLGAVAERQLGQQHDLPTLSSRRPSSSRSLGIASLQTGDGCRSIRSIPRRPSRSGPG